MSENTNSEFPPNAQPFDENPSSEYRRASDYYSKIKELEKSNFKDSQTGCYNRNAWDDFENNFDVGRGDKTTIIMIDLNGLKNINDNLGHLNGDEYIKNTASYLQEVFSRKGDRIFRIGGDEFIIACEHVIPEKRNEFNSYVDLHFNQENLYSKNLDFAVGISHSNFQEDISIKDILKRADEAMYQDKQRRKSQNPSLPS